MGRVFGARNAVYQERGKFALEAMAEIGVDVVNLTTIDLMNMGEDYLRENFAKYKIPLVSANLRATSGDVFWQPYIIKKIKGVKIGITGITPSGTAPTGNERRIVADDPVTALRELVPTLRKKAELVVVLSYVGLDKTKNIAMIVPGIDVLIAGGSGAKLDRPLKLNDAIIAKTGDRGQELGQMLILTDKKRNIISYDGMLVRLSSRVPEDSLLAERMQTCLEKTKDGNRTVYVGP